MPVAAAKKKRRRKVPKTFVKEVISPGVYWPRDKDGKPYRREVTAEDIQKWHDETKRAISNGNQIPMPYVHDPKAIPFLQNQPKPGSFQNGGYVKDLRIREDGMLEAIVEAATVQDAKKFGTSSRQVSFWEQPWVDGHGNKYEHAWRHLAVTNHPVNLKQKNFEPVAMPSEGLALSLWMAIEPDQYGQDIGNPDAEQQNPLESVLEKLAKFGLALPDTTCDQNLVQNLDAALTAVLSYREQREGEGDERLEQPPEGAKRQQPAPLAMATDKELQFALDTVRATPNNPATSKPWTADELKAGYQAHQATQPTLEFSTEQKSQLAAIQKQAKLRLGDRIQALIASKRITLEYANTELAPLLNATDLKFSTEGDVLENTPLHTILNALEKAAPGAAMHGQIDDLEDSADASTIKFSAEGFTVHEHPDSWREPKKADSKELQEAGDRMAAYLK